MRKLVIVLAVFLAALSCSPEETVEVFPECECTEEIYLLYPYPGVYVDYFTGAYHMTPPPPHNKQVLSFKQIPCTQDTYHRKTDTYLYERVHCTNN